MLIDPGNPWRRRNTGRVTIQRCNKVEAERAAQDLVERGYEIISSGTHGDNYHAGFRSSEVLETGHKSAESYGSKCEYYIVLQRL